MEDDEEVVFQDSALYDHLKNTGFTDEELAAENQLVRCVNPGTIPDSEGDNMRRRPPTKPTFWQKLTNSIDDAFWDENWNEQLTQVHHKHADEVTDDILESSILEEEDGVYIENFSISMQSYRPAVSQTETSIMGLMVMQLAVLGVSLAYGGFRMIYLKSPDASSRVYVWSIDTIAVLLTITAMLPTTVKSASAGRAVSRLNSFSKTCKEFLQQATELHKLTGKSVRIIQEFELVSRGFTMITPTTPVTRLEQGDIWRKFRQCPKLRKLTFITIREMMLEVKSAAQNLLDRFPSHVEIEGLANYLANQPLKDYGPCVNIVGSNVEAHLRIATEDFSLAAIKAMLELYKMHMSEFLRVLAMSCLTQAEEHKTNSSFQNQSEVLEKLLAEIKMKLKPLIKLYILHKAQAATDKHDKQQSDRPPFQQTKTEALYIAVHSLALHLMAAQNRLSQAENELEQLADSNKEKTEAREETLPSSDFLGKLELDLKVVQVDLNACSDCVTETEKQMNRIQKKADTKGPSHEKPSAEPTGGPPKEPVSLFEMGDPVIVDQVFEAYTEDTEDNIIDDSWDLLSDEERERQKQERHEAVRMLKELRSVIAVRAVEREERERQAFQRQNPGAQFQNPISLIGKQLQSHSAAHTYPSNYDNNSFKRELSCDNDDVDESAAGVESLRFQGLPTKFSQSSETESSAEVDPIKQRIMNLGGSGFPFPSAVANQAVAMSQQMVALSEDTFGDDDDSSDEDTA